MDPSSLLDDRMISRLVGRVRGDVLRPGDVGYDSARTAWNSRLDRRPGLIVRCADPDDVVAAIDLAREETIPLAVRGGGHDYAGNSTCDGGLLIDLSPMNAVQVDPRALTVRVQTGATWGEVDRATQRFDLATIGGTVSTVGVAGYTLGGGTGHISRAHGLAIDNLLSADLVTAAGQRVCATETENPDLFWGIRGGGGNFGVATSFEFALHPIGPDVLAGQIVYRLEDAPGVLRAYREFMKDAPDELVCYAFFIRVPPVPAFAEEHHGQVVIDLVLVYTGSVAVGEEVVRPLRTLADPILDWVEPQPYAAVQQTFDAGVPKGLRWYTRAHSLSALSDAALDVLVRHAEPLPGTGTMVYLAPGGGAISRPDPTATAFAHRDAAFDFHVLAGWEEPEDDEALMSWVRTFHDDMTPHATGGVYVNLLGEDESERVRVAYGENYDRLVALKNEWDPENIFRMNHNIRPTV